MCGILWDAQKRKKKEEGKLKELNININNYIP